MSSRELDTRGLLCPLPVIRTQDAIKAMAVDELLTIYATDPGTLQDIPSWCRVHGHALLSIDEKENEICFQIKVAPE
jgi:tRNA 2-thiouridine synthesizing protein A